MFKRNPFNFTEYDYLNNLKKRLKYIYDYGLITKEEQKLFLSKLCTDDDPIKNFNRSKYYNKCNEFENIPSLLGVSLRCFIFKEYIRIRNKNTVLLTCNLKECEKKWNDFMLSVVNEQGFYRNVSYDSLKEVINSNKKQFKTAFRKRKTDWNYYKDLEYQKSRENEIVELYGVNYKDLDFDEVPICGYLGAIKSKSDIEYGDIKIELKKENLINRTTFTCGDSHDMHNKITASLVLEPNISAVYFLDEFSCFLGTLKKAYNKSMEELVFKQLKVPYIELQFHGQVTLKDVKKVTILKYSLQKQFTQKMIQEFNKYNIEYDVL